MGKDRFKRPQNKIYITKRIYLLKCSRTTFVLERKTFIIVVVQIVSIGHEGAMGVVGQE